MPELFTFEEWEVRKGRTREYKITCLPKHGVLIKLSQGQDWDSSDWEPTEITFSSLGRACAAEAGAFAVALSHAALCARNWDEEKGLLAPSDIYGQ